MNKINILLKKYQKEFYFDNNDFAFYEDFCKNSSKENIEKKINQFKKFFKSFEKSKETQRRKLDKITNGAVRDLQRSKNKILISQIEKLKNNGLSRLEICQKLGISKRRMHSLHCINTFILKNK